MRILSIRADLIAVANVPLDMRLEQRSAILTYLFLFMCFAMFAFLACVA